MNSKNLVKLKSVSKFDFSFLYELLLERDQKVNISHKKMPTYKQHVRFMNSKPYLKWYIIYFDDTKIGSIYLSKQNEIGAQINKKWNNENILKIVIKLLMQKNPKSRYLVNINPKNKKFIKFFKNQGFKLIQYTYELMKE